MLKDKTEDLLKGFFGVFGLACLVILAVAAAPALLIWTVNSISEVAGSKFYIEHSLWTYFLALILLWLVRGGK